MRKISAKWRSGAEMKNKRRKKRTEMLKRCEKLKKFEQE